MLNYILQILLFQLLFLIGYDIFHKKDTFFNANRFYLLVTSMVSFILPLIHIKSIKENIPEKYIVDLPTVFIGQQPEIQVTEHIVNQIQTTTIIFDDINWWLVVYNIGVIFMLFRFCKRLIKIQKLKKTATYTLLDSYKIYNLKDSKDAFSYLNSIFLGSDIIKSERDQILTHELVHLEQKHSFDLLWFEILKITCWFNPLVYIYQSRITALHEFIADDRSVHILGKKKYYQQLLTTVFDTEDIEFINQFFSKSLIKRRIQMLQKSKSKNTAKMKYLFIIPSLAVMLIMASFSELSEQFGTEATSIQGLNNKITDKLSEDEVTQKTDIPFQINDQKNSEKTNKIDETSNEKSKDPSQKSAEENGELSESSVSKSNDLTVSFNDEDEKIIYRLNQIKQQIEDGKTEFATQAVLHSEDPGSKANGGFYIITKDAPFVKNFIDQAFKLKEGEISDPFKTDFGWHILTVDKIDGEKRSIRHILIQKKTEFPFEIVDKTPTTKNCENIQDKTSRKNCVVEEIQEFVLNNFNVRIARNNGLLGVNRIYSSFKIDSLGNITDIKARAPIPALEQEVKRVLELIPTMIPGEKNGKKVDVLYSLPIVFNVGENQNGASSIPKKIKTSNAKPQKFVNFSTEENACLNTNSISQPDLDNYLKIKTGKYEVIVQVISIKDEKTVRKAYIGKDKTYYLRNIPEDIYRVNIVYGEGYEEKTENGICKGSFANEMLFEEDPNKLDFKTFTYEDGRLNVPSYSLSLDYFPENSSQKTKQKNEKSTNQQEPVLTENLSDIEGHDISQGYYLITNIFKTKSYFDRRMAALKKQGLQPKFFKNPKDLYYYVYLKRYETYNEALKNLKSDIDGTYTGDMYILKIQ